MTIGELIAFQKNFDTAHVSKFPWNSNITDSNIEMLEFLLVSLTGEVGETANIVKKVVRGDFLLDEKKTDLQEELADIFIYLLKIAYQLGLDLEKAYFEKMENNRRRFEKYEKRV